MQPEQHIPRVMLVDDQPARAAILERALIDNGYMVVARLPSAAGLLAQVGHLNPDVIIVDMDSPDRDTLENMALLQRDLPRPVVMFAGSEDEEIMARAIHAGVSAYVVDGLQPARVKAIVNVAITRFREYQALRDELEKTRGQLADRRLIDKAKGLLMSRRQLSEDQAYQMLRRMAMDRGQRLVEVSRNLLAFADLLEGQ